MYVNGAIGGGVLTFSGNTNLAKTYYGLDASAEVCRANVNGFDLCGGVNVFHALGGGKKTTTVGLTSITTDTDVTAVGGFVKVRKQVGQVGLAPYAGFRRIMTETTVTGLGAPARLEDNGNSAFGGVELDYAVMDEKLFVSLKAEIGRTLGGQINHTTFLFAPSIKIKF